MRHRPTSFARPPFSHVRFFHELVLVCLCFLFRFKCSSFSTPFFSLLLVRLLSTSRGKKEKWMCMCLPVRMLNAESQHTARCFKFPVRAVSNNPHAREKRPPLTRFRLVRLCCSTLRGAPAATPPLRSAVRARRQVSASGQRYGSVWRGIDPTHLAAPDLPGPATGPSLWPF
jgi:hypothetical protein